MYNQDRILQAMDNVTLALHLLCERANPASFWLPYIRTLPQEYDTPLFYEQDEVQLLQGTQAIQDVLSQYRNTARQYAYFYKLIQVSDFAVLPVSQFMWSLDSLRGRPHLTLSEQP